MKAKRAENFCAVLEKQELYCDAMTAPQQSTESWKDVLRALVAYARQQKLTVER